jgi:hypothetical protein
MQLQQTSPQQPPQKLAIAFCRDGLFRISSRYPTQVDDSTLKKLNRES